MHDVGTRSNAKIFANIFISFIGAGVLGVPFAFKEVRTVGNSNPVDVIVTFCEPKVEIINTVVYLFYGRFCVNVLFVLEIVW